MASGNGIANAWRALRGLPTLGELSTREQIAELKSTLAHQEIELREAHDEADALRSAHDSWKNRRKEATGSRTDALFTDLAAPVSQLKMQAALMESGKEISGRSIMALAGQVIEVLEAAGLEPIGEVGRTILFDPQEAEPLSSESSFSPGVCVVVRFVGYRYQGRTVRKALVTAEPSRQS